MATLATTTALMALLACLFVGLPEAGAEGEGADEVDLPTLRETLQSAIELEWSTIPPYLSAALSIKDKDKDGKNKQVYDMLRGILVNEMHHMALAANMLNAIGGEPVLNDPNIAPRYPGPLPAGCLPHLTVTLEKMSKSHTEEVFMGIETPECEDSVTKFHDHLSKVASSGTSNEMSENFQDALREKCEEKHYSPDTIVSNIDTAIRAVAYIVSQGEGGEPCNPYVNAEITDGDPMVLETCHYYKFAEIVKGKEVTLEVRDNPSKSDDPEYEDFFSPCPDKACKGIQFEGDSVAFDEDAVWPILSNPSTGLYPPRSKARRLSDRFNSAYVDLMQCLHDVVNASPDIKMGDCIGKMHGLQSVGEELVKTPIDPEGDPNTGPNVAPTYEFYYGAQEMENQQQQRIEL
ncbi:hypothetical protein Bbelb_266840 [Branchiostoma belcheri]|nr:hypothetical protein Bbelb_266840 [Branchiostoma belcheri]